jgi:hypothetical protein
MRGPRASCPGWTLICLDCFWLFFFVLISFFFFFFCLYITVCVFVFFPAWGFFAHTLSLFFYLSLLHFFGLLAFFLLPFFLCTHFFCWLTFFKSLVCNKIFSSQMETYSLLDSHWKRRKLHSHVAWQESIGWFLLRLRCKFVFTSLIPDVKDQVPC